MKRKTLIMLSVLILFSSVTAFSQVQEIDEKTIKRIKGWEEKINRERQPPEQVMDVIGLKPGMIVGEVGAGRGRYTVHLARRVGNTGRVYANDIDAGALNYLRNRCRRNDIRNIELILGEEEKTLFPENSLDMVVMVWVFHMLDKPLPMMKSVLSSLKPGATLVILDPPDDEIDAEIKQMTGKLDPKRLTIQERIEKAAGESGFKIVRIDRSLPVDSIFILRAESRQPSGTVRLMPQ